MSPLLAEQARPKPDGERLNADLKEFGNDKMAEFVKDNSGTKYEDKSQRVNYITHSGPSHCSLRKITTLRLDQIGSGCTKISVRHEEAHCQPQKGTHVTNISLDLLCFLCLFRAK